MHYQYCQIKNNLIVHCHQAFVSVELNCLLLLLASLLLSVTARADEAMPLPLNHSSNAIGEYLVVLAEKKQPLSLQQAIQAYRHGKFSTWKKPVLSFGIGASPRWLVAKVENKTEYNLTRRLVIENPWLDKADIYIMHNAQIVKKLHLGDTFPFTERNIRHRFFIVDHEYTTGTTQLFIRVETPDPMLLPIFFGSQEDSATRDVFNGYSYGLLYGIVIGLLLYNFILYIRLRLTRYLFYVIYLMMFIAMNLSYTGHSYPLFWPDNPFWQQWMLPLLISLYAMSGIVFAFSFLQTLRIFPYIFYLSLITCIVFLIYQWLFFIAEFQAIAVSTAIGFVIFFSVFTFILALLSLKHKHREVLYFLIATIATLIGASITAMTAWSILRIHYKF